MVELVRVGSKNMPLYSFPFVRPGFWRGCLPLNGLVILLRLISINVLQTKLAMDSILMNAIGRYGIKMDNRQSLETKSSPTIETTDLSRRLGGFTAVDHIAVSIERGEIFGLIGPNGAGKSTLIKAEPTAVRQHIGYVPQLLSSEVSLTAYENLLPSARLYRVPFKDRADCISEALAGTSL